MWCSFSVSYSVETNTKNDSNFCTGVAKIIYCFQIGFLEHCLHVLFAHKNIVPPTNSHHWSRMSGFSSKRFDSAKPSLVLFSREIDILISYFLLSHWAKTESNILTLKIQLWMNSCSCSMCKLEAMCFRKLITWSVNSFFSIPVRQMWSELLQNENLNHISDKYLLWLV